MRWFFILLTLTNVVVAIWINWLAEEQLSLPVPVGESSEQAKLHLLVELPQQSLRPIPRAAVSSPAAEPPATHPLPLSGVSGTSGSEVPEPLVPPTPQTASCVRISPFAKTADVDLILQKLEMLNLPVVGRGEGETERQTYWVVIPPYKTDKLARDASAKLAKAKVRDFLLVRSGELENGISLGLFSQREGAENRIREIQALNLDIHDPEIRMRTTSVRSHWLIARVSEQEVFRSLQQQLDTDGLQSTPVECPP